jgi:hypothetical protein
MRIHTASVAAALGLALAISGEARAATTFLFEFSSKRGADGTANSPIVGTGTFTSSINLGPGVYALSSLTGYSMSFTFGNTTYTNLNIATPLSEVAVDVTSFGAGERLVFTENGPVGDGGPYKGSLDLVSGSSYLTFEPSLFGGHDYFGERSGGSLYFANYLATSETQTTGLLSGLTPRTTSQDAPAPAPGAGLAGLLGLCALHLVGRLRSGASRRS